VIGAADFAGGVRVHSRPAIAAAGGGDGAGTKQGGTGDVLVLICGRIGDDRRDRWMDGWGARRPPHRLVSWIGGQRSRSMAALAGRQAPATSPGMGMGV